MRLLMAITLLMTVASAGSASAAPASAAPANAAPASAAPASALPATLRPVIFEPAREPLATALESGYSKPADRILLAKKKTSSESDTESDNTADSADKSNGSKTKKSKSEKRTVKPETTLAEPEKKSIDPEKSSSGIDKSTGTDKSTGINKSTGTDKSTGINKSAEIDKSAEKEKHSFSGNSSWYGIPFHGHKTASGEVFNMNKCSAAHLTLPLPTKALVEDPRTGNAVLVKVNDRGPYVKTRVMDLSREAARELGTLPRGVAFVEITVLETPHKNRKTQ